MTELLRVNPTKIRRGPAIESDGAMSDIDLLHSISMELIGEQDRVELYGKIVDAAIAITGSQYGTMQVLGPSGDGEGEGIGLQLLCSRGLPPDAVKFWQWVSPAAYSSCTVALKTGRRAIIADYEQWDEIAGTEDLLAFRRSRIRSAQTTPLRSRDGNLLGMISTHWNDPHEPTERDLRLLDIVARQAADLLERTIAEEALRTRERELDHIVATLRETEALQKILTGELSHRVKNMLSVVASIVDASIRGATDLASARRDVTQRLISLATAHDLLTARNWVSAEVRTIVLTAAETLGIGESRLEIEGPALELPSRGALQLALTLHELGTNAIKYGALSNDTGRIRIAWANSAGPDPVFTMEWCEQGGPSVAAPTRKGFGRRLIESVTAAEFQGTSRLDYAPGGVRWTLEAPLDPVAVDVPAAE